MTLDLQGHVDQSFGIALDKVESLQVTTPQGVVGGMTLAVDHQALQQDITRQSQAILGKVVVDVAIDAVLVDTLGKQL